MKESVELKKIKDQNEREILQLLKEKDQCMMGEILMKLKLSYRKGYNLLNSLSKKNLVSNREKAPYYTLKVELR